MQCKGKSHRPLALHPPRIAVAVPPAHPPLLRSVSALLRKCFKAAFESPSFFNPLRTTPVRMVLSIASSAFLWHLSPEAAGSHGLEGRYLGRYLGKVGSREAH